MIEASRLFSRVVVAGVGLLGVLAISAVSEKAKSSSKAKADPEMVSAHLENSLQSKQARGPVQNVRFIVYDVGIYPPRAKVRPGLVAIAIEDLSGGTEGVVVTKLEGGEAAVRVGVVGRLQNKWRGRSEMRLDPGRYEVIDSSRPDNRAELVVEP